MLKIKYIHIENQEADIVCSQLVRKKYVDGVLTNDMDLLAYDCNKVFRNLNFKEDTLTEYRTNLILSKLNLTRQQCIDIIIILGCDYCDKVYRKLEEFLFNSGFRII